MSISEPKDPSRFLRLSLRGNAMFSTLSGLAFLLGSGSVAAFLGDVPAWLVGTTGAQLLLFAGALAWLASRPEMKIPLVLGVIVADLLWVIGTIVVVYAEIFTRGGVILAVALADVVLLLAVLQSIGVHRITRRGRSIQLAAS